MANRRKMKAAKAEEERQKRLAEARKNQKRYIKIAGGLVILALVVVFFYFNQPGPVYVQCFSNGTELKEDYTVNMLVLNGSSNNSFFRIPVPLGRQGQNIFKMGVYTDCKYPINIQGQSDYGQEYTKLHIQSPYVHDYTLGDFFGVWDHEMRGVPYYLGSDGLQVPGSVRINGPVVVSFSFNGPTQPADPNLLMHSGDTITIRVNP